MPVIVELRLRPECPVEPTTRQLHGLACALFEGAHPGGESWHNAHDKPFSVWPLRRVPGGWLLRGAWLPGGFPRHVLAACGQVRLGPATCTVSDVAFRSASHHELARVPLIDGVRLRLLSAAYFSSGGAHVAEPDPRLIAGSWRRRWNASLPKDHELAVDAALWRDIHLALHVTGSGLHAETRDNGYHLQPGLIGTATMRLEREAPAAVRLALAALARFAEFCGTGAQVTHGFGATKTTLLRSSWSSPTAVDPDRGPVPCHD
jgi:hypothetical protein